MATTGKRDPCPCGSGQIYEQCCMIADLQGAGLIENRAVVPGPGASSDPGTFRSRMISSDELQRRCGLSREHMYFLLYDPFAAPALVSFNIELKRFPESQFFRIFDYLVKGIGTEGLKATAKGNLPPGFVRETARWYYGEKEYLDRKTYMTFRTETDYPVLNTVRLTAQIAGFVRKYRNRFQLTKAGREVLEGGLEGQSFLQLFKAYGTRFNWAYNDGFPDIPIVQQAFLFTLYLLDRYGDRFRPVSFYEDLFLAAFPEEIHEVPQQFGDPREETLRRCFSVRSLSRFAHFFGFAEITDLSYEESSNDPMVKKTEFLDEWIRFGKQAAED